jgi:hypothetical protein
VLKRLIDLHGFQNNVLCFLSCHLSFIIDMLMVAMFSTDSDMLPRKKTTSKDPTVEASTRGS